MSDPAMETMSQAIARLRAAGFTGNWIALSGGRFRSIDLGVEFEAIEVRIRHVVRFEGASDPGDESILYALAGPHDLGLYAAAFGVDATVEDVEVTTLLGTNHALMEPPATARAMEDRIADAAGSPRLLRALFEELVDRVGHDAASQQWWDHFAASDAAET